MTSHWRTPGSAASKAARCAAVAICVLELLNEGTVVIVGQLDLGCEIGVKLGDFEVNITAF